jgi:hypothetical protein
MLDLGPNFHISGYPDISGHLAFFPILFMFCGRNFDPLAPLIACGKTPQTKSPPV